MEEKVFKIPKLDTIDKKIDYYLIIMKPFLSNVRKKELEVLRELIKANAEKIAIPEDKDRFKVILSTEGRKQIEANLGISSATLRNCLTALRTKRLLLKDNIIPKTLMLDLTKENFKISFII